MHDLRRRALESGKTTSKKLKSRQSSRANSRANSPATSPNHSRAGSRAASDEEDGQSDETSLSAASFDQLTLEDTSRGRMPATWEEDLRDLMNDIIERSWKKSHNQTRMADLNAYIRTLTSYYAYDVVAEREAELIDEFLKTIKSGGSEDEKLLAMQALAMTIITIPSSSMGATVAAALKLTISDSTSASMKSAAIHTLGLAWFYEHISDTQTLEKMKYFLKITSSDGEEINAHDEPEPVTAAIEEWGFLAAQITDFTDGAGEEYFSEDLKDPMEVLIDQLDSSFPTVQIAAGENIALLYEKAELDLDSDQDFSSADDLPDVPWVTQPRYDEGELKHKLLALSTIHTRSLSAKTKKALHSSFDDILHSVEHPTDGPQYQKALNSETGNPYGSGRKALRVHQKGAIRIDSWEKLHTLQGLQRVLQGGFLLHYQENQEVYGKLPTLDTVDVRKVVVTTEMVGGEDGEVEELARERRLKHRSKRNKTKRMGWGGDEE